LASALPYPMREKKCATLSGLLELVSRISLTKKYVALNKELENSSHAREAFLKFLLTETEIEFV
jgi:hypothetical protein